MNAGEAKHRLHVARTLLGTGMIQPTRPDRAVRAVRALRRWGPTPAAAYTGSAARYPHRAAIIDERAIRSSDPAAASSAASTKMAHTGGWPAKVSAASVPALRSVAPCATIRIK